MGLRSWLYQAARLMGDVNAVRRGPAAVAKRIARKAMLRQSAGAVRKVLGW